MQIHCYNCHKPFALNRDAVLGALDLVHQEDLHHYNAQCPFCRRVNRVSKEELLRAAPDWEPAQVETEADEQE